MEKSKQAKAAMEQYLLSIRDEELAKIMHLTGRSYEVSGKKTKERAEKIHKPAIPKSIFDSIAFSIDGTTASMEAYPPELVQFIGTPDSSDPIKYQETIKAWISAEIIALTNKIQCSDSPLEVFSLTCTLQERLFALEYPEIRKKVEDGVMKRIKQQTSQKNSENAKKKKGRSRAHTQFIDKLIKGERIKDLPRLYALLSKYDVDMTRKYGAGLVISVQSDRNTDILFNLLGGSLVRLSRESLAKKFRALKKSGR